MNQPLPSYPDYKPAGLPWLAEVPAHWEMTSNSRLFRIKKETVGSTHSEYKLLSLTLKGVIPRDLENAKGKFPAEFDTYQRVQAGNFIFCLFDIDETPRTVGLALQPGMITGAYTVLDSLQPDAAQYLYHYYLHLDSLKLLRPLYTGLRKVIKKNTFLSLKTPFPPLPEQQRIVAFLDGKTRQIARLLRNKRQLIKLLTEQKQALIHRAVTQGLNADAPRKESGVAWLGEVPAHWEVKRTKYFYQEVDARSTTGKETHLSMSQKFGLVPNSTLDIKRMLSESYVGGKLCEKDDLVLNRLKAHLGVFALANEPGLISPDYTVLRATKALCHKYFELVLKTPACRVEFRIRTKGIVEGFWRLYTNDFYDIKLPFPPVDEQIRIIEHIETDSSLIDQTIARAHREIELIQEYRTRLIADVVTGRVDVRHLADAGSSLELPAEDELELEDEESEEEILTETEDGRD